MRSPGLRVRFSWGIVYLWHYLAFMGKLDVLDSGLTWSCNLESQCIECSPDHKNVWFYRSAGGIRNKAILHEEGCRGNTLQDR